MIPPKRLCTCILTAILPFLFPSNCDACLSNIFYINEAAAIVPLPKTIASSNAKILLQFDPSCQVQSVGILLSLSNSFAFQCLSVEGNIATFEVTDSGESFASAWFYTYQNTTECQGSPDSSATRDWEMNPAESAGCQVTAISLNLGNVRIFPNLVQGSALCLPWNNISLRAATADCSGLERVEIEWQSSTMSFVNDDELSVVLSEGGRISVRATPFDSNNVIGASKVTTFDLEDCFKMWRQPLPTPPSTTEPSITPPPTPAPQFSDPGRPTEAPFTQRTPPPVPVATRPPKPPLSADTPTPKPTRIPKPPIATTTSSPTPSPVFTDFGRPTDVPFTQRTPPPFPVATRPPKPPLSTDLPTPKPTRIPKPPVLPTSRPTPAPVFTDFGRPTKSPDFKIAGESTPSPAIIITTPTDVPPSDRIAPSESPTTGFTIA